VGRVLQVSVKPKIYVAQQLGHIHNLPRVEREMFHHMIDDFHDRFVITLHDNCSCEFVRGNAGDDRYCLIHCFFQYPSQHIRIHSAASRELSVALARIGSASEGGYNPLTHVAAQVQDKIADRVAFVRATPPYLLGRKQPETVLDAALLLPEFLHEKSMKRRSISPPSIR
jgi:hypothetical protein